MMSGRGVGDARFSIFFSMSLEFPLKLENGLTLPSFDRSFDDEEDFPGCDVDFGDGTVVDEEEFNEPDELDFW
jgi:hypothetical protein